MQITCAKCKISKPAAEFNYNANKGKYYSYCKSCGSAYCRKWKEKRKSMCTMRTRSRAIDRQCVKGFKYSEVCSCYYSECTKEIVFYNELLDTIINVKSNIEPEQAAEIMQLWQEYAPKSVHCDILTI